MVGATEAVRAIKAAKAIKAVRATKAVRANKAVRAVKAVKAGPALRRGQVGVRKAERCISALTVPQCPVTVIFTTSLVSQPSSHHAGSSPRRVFSDQLPGYCEAHGRL